MSIFVSRFSVNLVHASILECCRINAKQISISSMHALVYLVATVKHTTTFFIS